MDPRQRLLSFVLPPRATPAPQRRLLHRPIGRGATNERGRPYGPASTAGRAMCVINLRSPFLLETTSSRANLVPRAMCVMGLRPCIFLNRQLHSPFSPDPLLCICPYTLPTTATSHDPPVRSPTPHCSPKKTLLARARKTTLSGIMSSCPYHASFSKEGTAVLVCSQELYVPPQNLHAKSHPGFTSR